MQCNEFRRQAGDWMEGAHGATATGHLAQCPYCRGLIADLEVIRDAARELPEVGPPARVWLALREQLAAEGLIREQSWAAGLTSWLPAMPRPVLAGAYLALLLAGAVLVGVQTSPQFVRVAQAPAIPEITKFTDAQSQMTEIENRTVALVRRNSPIITASYRENLAILDKFIATCEKTVREEPENELALDYLYGAYQQKADLLANMVARGVRGE